MRRVVLFLSCLLAAVPAHAAQAQTFAGDYTVSIYGLTIARSRFSSRISGDRFEVQGSVRSAGLARLFDDTTGTTSVSGRLLEKGPRPDAFRADYVSGKKKATIDIRFSNGSVTKTHVTPPPKKRGADWLPLGAGDLKAVADPLSATLVRAKNPAEVCRRTVRIYDGEMRMNLALSAAGTKEVAVPGFAGTVVTCKARFVPVSGYRKTRRAIAFLRDSGDIAVTFAPLGQTGLYAPVRASVRTQIGTLLVRARNFAALD